MIGQPLLMAVVLGLSKSVNTRRLTGTARSLMWADDVEHKAN
jgi:hypothetical protein